MKNIDLISEIREDLINMQDKAYRDFHSRLVPTLPKDSIIGVRTPALRRYAKHLAKDCRVDVFLSDLPHKYYEENNLHVFIVSDYKDFDLCIDGVREFVPYIDNWATCDVFRPKCFNGNQTGLYKYVEKWLCSTETYTLRFGIGMLNSYYLDGFFEEEHLRLVSQINSDEYYVKMMIAWYFATALAKQQSSTLAYLEDRRLDKWTHNKTIQKAIESYRIDEDFKHYLKQLRI